MLIEIKKCQKKQEQAQGRARSRKCPITGTARFENHGD